MQPCRSREGAWIEIPTLRQESVQELSRSREGAWIEIPVSLLEVVSLSRSREGAWIEITVIAYGQKDIDVAPVRERGLKYECYKCIFKH